MLLAGLALTAIELGRSVPAWLRVREAKSGDGISPVSIGVLAGTGAAWIAVAVLADSVAAAVATVVWLVFHIMLWREVTRFEPSMNRTIACTASVSLVATGFVAFIGHLTGHLNAALGAEIVAATVSYSVPALFRGMRSRTTAGLSLISLLVNSIEGAIYLVAGVGLGGITPPGKTVPTYALFGGIALASNIPRLIRSGYRRVSGRDESFSEELSRASEATDPDWSDCAESRDG
jgi:uncharacterized protein with PQ loop repeat